MHAKHWQLKPGVDIRALPLSAQEGFVASRLDGSTDAHALEIITGLPSTVISAALEKLDSLGALGSDNNEKVEVSSPQSSHSADEEIRTEEIENEEPTEPQEESEFVEKSGIHRKLYQTNFAELTVEERIAKAKIALEPELSALCFDAMPAVIQAIFENSHAGLAHARLIATNHHNPAGLEHVVNKAAFAADEGVRRALVKNVQLTEGLIRRVWGGKRLLDQYKLAISREMPEHSRRRFRDLMRQRFTTSQAEERVELILRTDGRSFSMLSGLTLDSKTVALLCARTYSSTTLVQNIARFSAAPPQLIAHLLRQDLVKRSQMLKQVLHRHPNAPKDGHRS